MREEMNRRHPELNVSIIGRANRMKKVVGDAFVTENVHLDGEVLKYKQLEGQFAQPNAQVTIRNAFKFAGRVLRFFFFIECRFSGTILWQWSFHSGVSAVLSNVFIHRNFENEHSCCSRKHKNEWNYKYAVALSAEEVVQAIDGEREFTRLKNTELDLTALNIKTVLVDPPRAGCGQMCPKCSKDSIT